MKRIISVRDAMTVKVLTAGENTTVARAAKMMADRGVGSLVVLRNKKPVGILTERDLLMKVLGPNIMPAKIKIGKIMSSPLVTISPDADITEAAKIMAKNRIRRLPVVDRGNLVGIISASDITAMSPELIEVVAHREEQDKESVEESVCENCGEVTTSLYEVNGMWVCEDCRDSMSG
ncbi:MAG: CBS domain-containing protein [Candidatus Hadarchaeales archaeon]